MIPRDVQVAPACLCWNLSVFFPADGLLEISGAGNFFIKWHPNSVHRLQFAVTPHVCEPNCSWHSMAQISLWGKKGTKVAHCQSDLQAPRSGLILHLYSQPWATQNNMKRRTRLRCKSRPARDQQHQEIHAEQKLSTDGAPAAGLAESTRKVCANEPKSDNPNGFCASPLQLLDSEERRALLHIGSCPVGGSVMQCTVHIPRWSEQNNAQVCDCVCLVFQHDQPVSQPHS